MLIEALPLQSRDPTRIALDAFLVIFPKDCELLSLERSLSVDRERRLIAAEVTGSEVGDQVDHPQSLLAGYSASSAKIMLNVFTRFGIFEVLLARPRNQKPAGQILHVHQRLMVIGSEVEFGDVYRRRIRNRYPIFNRAADCRHFRQHPYGFGIADQPGKLFADM